MDDKIFKFFQGFDQTGDSHRCSFAFVGRLYGAPDLVCGGARQRGVVRVARLCAWSPGLGAIVGRRTVAPGLFLGATATFVAGGGGVGGRVCVRVSCDFARQHVAGLELARGAGLCSREWHCSRVVLPGGPAARDAVSRQSPCAHGPGPVAARRALWIVAHWPAVRRRARPRCAAFCGACHYHYSRARRPPRPRSPGG